MPMRRPLEASKWETKRTVVVLPLVPVTATTGIRPFSPSGNICSMTARPTSRPVPNEGLRCIRSPGAALTSMMPPFCSSKGRKIVSQTMSTPQISKPTIWAAKTALAATSGCTSSVTSVAEPPVDKLALFRMMTRIPLGATLLSSRFCSCKHDKATSSIRMRVKG